MNRNIVINYDILFFILDEFISWSISYKVVIIKDNSVKYKYVETYFAENNNKNNLYYTIEFTKMNKLRSLNGCIYIDGITPSI